MDELAIFLARHAALTFLVVLALAVGVAWLVLHLARRYGERAFRVSSRLWDTLAATRPALALRRRYPRTWSFLGARLSRQEFLGLHLTLGLAALAVFVAAFAELVDELEPDEELARFDETFTRELRHSVSPELKRVAGLVTHLGDVPLLVLLATGVAIVLLLRRRTTQCLAWVATTGGGGLLNRLLKASFRRERPGDVDPDAVVSGFSFPSGHAMGSMVVYGMLAYLLLRRLASGARLAALLVALALILSIGASRILLRVHYATDVAAGFAAGAAWLAICIAGTEIALRWPRNGALKEGSSPSPAE